LLFALGVVVETAITGQLIALVGPENSGNPIIRAILN
jgi:hypothetical protein